MRVLVDSARFPLFPLPLRAVIVFNDWNGAERLNGWNDWNGPIPMMNAVIERLERFERLRFLVLTSPRHRLYVPQREA